MRRTRVRRGGESVQTKSNARGVHCHAPSNDDATRRASRPRKVKTCEVLDPRQGKVLSTTLAIALFPRRSLPQINQRFVNCRHETASVPFAQAPTGCSDGFSYCVACHDWSPANWSPHRRHNWSPVRRLRLRGTTHGAPHHRLRVRRTAHWAPHRWAAPHRRLRRTTHWAPHRRLRLRQHRGVGPQGRRLPHKAVNASVPYPR